MCRIGSLMNIYFGLPVPVQVRRRTVVERTSRQSQVSRGDEKRGGGCSLSDGRGQEAGVVSVPVSPLAEAHDHRCCGRPRVLRLTEL